MADAQSPGPGRLTAEAALDEVKREVARRNEEAYKQARKRRAVRERQRLEERRRWERL